MTARIVPFLASVLLIISFPIILLAAEWYVDGSVAQSGDGTAWETAFQKIQEGIHTSSDGDTVIVAEGTYFENINFGGKNVVLRGTDPLDADVVKKTVIDGGQAGPVVTFDGTEDDTCVLAEFTVRNGNAADGGGICGGTWESRTHARIQNNTIVSNSADYGGGIAYCDGAILDNVVSQNSAKHSGGGMIWCDGDIADNQILQNTAEFGGGLCACAGSIRGNLINANEALGTFPLGFGGGVYHCDGAIQNNLIAGNSAGWFGGGLSSCNGVIQCNTIVANSAAWGGGLSDCLGLLEDCIIWGNTASSGNPQLNRSCDPSHSWVGGGNPRFADQDGPDDDPNTYEDNDYFLLADSPCIDAGKNEDWMWHVTDLGGNPRISSGASSLTVDIGAYEYVPTPQVVNTWYVDGSALETGDGTCWETAFQKIQEGIDAASNGDTVVVAEGTYVENIEFKGKNIILQSNLDDDAISKTIIDGDQAGSVVTFLGTEDETCVLRGFTIRKGNAESGGGINGQGLGIGGAQARIENCVVTGNLADRGGGLSFCNGPIVNCTVSANQASQGAGLFYCGRMINCIVWDNGDGDQMYSSSAPSYSCVQNWTLSGEGNIVHYPHFEDPLSGDYHLRSWSPCIDGGHPAASFSGEPDPNGRRINMGAFGNTAEAAVKCLDADADGLPDNWEIEFFGHLAHTVDGDPDGDRLSNAHEWSRGTNPAVGGTRPVELYVDASAAASGDGVSWETAFKTIQEGIDAAYHGDIVIVAEGTHRERIVINGKNITLRSKDPLDGDVVLATIIDGGGGGSVVSFSGTEDRTCLLSGFTIQNGKAVYGGGICGGTPEYHTDATILNNQINGNSAIVSGGGIANCDGLIQNNTITMNSATGETGRGGGMAHCAGIIQNNTISQNSAIRAGGGLANCDGIIRNNVIADNVCDGAAGVNACYGSIHNNTIAENPGTWGGGVSWCHGIIRNCIIWGNEGGDVYASRPPTYSCVGDGSGGEGGISFDPIFTEGTYRLSADSPCIDAGVNEGWMQDSVDLDGNPRIWNSTVDMGAYEFGSFPFQVRDVVADGNTLQLTWNSRPKDNYTIFTCLDLTTGTWVSLETVASGGTSTTWTHPHLPANRQLFYRIEID